MEDKIFKEPEELTGVRKNVLLKDYTTYKIGGPAKYFFIAKNKESLIKALKISKEFKLPVFILGGGSKLLVSEKGFNGLVIKFQASNFKFQGKEVFADAGAALTELAYASAGAGLSGLEWVAGIPEATVGGAIYGHAQAFGIKMSDVVKSVEAINLKTFKFKNFSKKQCQFSLKDSIFKKSKMWAIVSAVLELKPKEASEIKKLIKNFLEYRKNFHPLNFPSAGSTFINPEIKIKNKKLLLKFPELKEYNEKGIIPAGYLIAKCGLAGKIVGKAQISEKHANFIINLGGAKAKDVLFLINLAKRKVKEKFNIELEKEVQLIGFK